MLSTTRAADYVICLAHKNGACSLSTVILAMLSSESSRIPNFIVSLEFSKESSELYK